MIRIWLLIFLGSASATAAQTVVDGSDKAIPDVVLKEFIRQITKNLKDPASAQIANIRLPENKAIEGILCADLNAKNAFGGYTGFHLVGYDFAKKERYSVEETLASGFAGGDEGYAEFAVAGQTGCYNTR
ncbi:MAG: hypothetical protein WA973_07345 [Mesorhizobium sp.]